MLSFSEVSVRATVLLFVTVTLNVKLPPGSTRVRGVAVLSTLIESQVLVALGPSPALASPVARLRLTPLTVTVVAALSTVTPMTADVSVTEQEPLASVVVQLGALRLPGPLTIVKLTVVPIGAFTYPV